MTMIIKPPLARFDGDFFQARAMPFFGTVRPPPETDAGALLLHHGPKCGG